MKNNQNQQNKSAKTRVSGSKKAAEKFGGEGDFGIPADEATAANDYPAGRAKGPQKGTGPSRTGSQGRRDVGVGTPVGPAGSGSGGDIDSDLIGIGGAGGLANEGPDSDIGAAATEGQRDPNASGPPAEEVETTPPGRVGGDVRVRGTTTTGQVSGSEDAASTSGGQEELRDIHDEDKTVNPLTGGPARANENRKSRTK